MKKDSAVSTVSTKNSILLNSTLVHLNIKHPHTNGITGTNIKGPKKNIIIPNITSEMYINASFLVYLIQYVDLFSLYQERKLLLLTCYIPLNLYLTLLSALDYAF